ncbi:MAG: endonuclease [Mangrovibacterium sp.]
MNKLILNFKYIAAVFALSLAWGLHSCNKADDYNPIPPDWVDPDGNNGGDTDGNIDGDTLTYHYVAPRVGNNGRIIVDQTPADYADTATMHVVAVAYDLEHNKPMDLESYYARAVGKKGEALRTALEVIIEENYTELTYGEARGILVEADLDPVDVSKLWCSYEENTVNAAWDQGATWNREHVWAKSKGLLDESSINNSYMGAGSDLYNLKTETSSVNSRKSNRDFVEDGDDATYFGTVGTAGYAPMKSARGDVARIIFYMQLRWGDERGIVVDNNVSNETTARHGKLDDLLKWNNEDPVDPFEIRRSNIVYKNQHNRNPFVDHPELIEYLFGSKQDEVWDGGVTYKSN